MKVRCQTSLWCLGIYVNRNMNGNEKRPQITHLKTSKKKRPQKISSFYFAICCLCFLILSLLFIFNNAT